MRKTVIGKVILLFMSLVVADALFGAILVMGSLATISFALVVFPDHLEEIKDLIWEIFEK